MTHPEKRVLDIAAKDIDAATGAHLGNLLQQLSADPVQAKQNRGRFVFAFDIDGLGVRDTPVYAVPAVREFYRALVGRCAHAAYFLHGDPAIAGIEAFALAQTELVPGNNTWQYRLGDYMQTLQAHAERVTEFCGRIGDDANAATDGLLLAIPAEALGHDPELRARVLHALAPAVRAAARDFDKLNAQPAGREILRDLLGRAEASAGMPRSDTPTPAAFARVLRMLGS